MSERDTVPPPPLGGIEVPAVVAHEDVPAIDATDRAWGLHFARVAREIASRAVTLTLPAWVSVVLVILAADASIHIVYLLWRMAWGGHGP